MISGLIRKSRQLADDPVLRRWLMGRVLGRWPKPAPFQAHRPPYLDGLLPLAGEVPSAKFTVLESSPPTGPIDLLLAGETINLAPGEAVAVFNRSFDDVETLLSLHRFAWARQSGRFVDSDWFAVLWQAWREKFSTPDDGWAWHPYTAAERAVNVLEFAHVFGLPGPADETLSLLAVHARIISERLEYFGDHHTSNHLVNNGRGLYVLGLTLGMDHAAEAGSRILLTEADRLFGPSGMLREGSSHYHLLLTRLYRMCADLARRANRPEADALAAIASRATGAAVNLLLPGGLPLVGDISPDITTENLLSELGLNAAAPGDWQGDGWLRADLGPWSALWHASPDGFSHMPGHGHQDMGSFELHAGGTAVFVDPGRGSYGEAGAAALYRSARVHNTLMLDGHDPFPPNRPYYDATFRRAVSGPLLVLERTDDSVSLTHHGFARLSGGGAHRRSWRFEDDRMVLDDQLEGRGRHTVTRTLVTPLALRQTDDGILLGDDGNFLLRCPDTEISIWPLTRWTAYGQGEAASAIVLTNRQPLSFSGTLSLEIRQT